MIVLVSLTSTGIDSKKDACREIRSCRKCIKAIPDYRIRGYLYGYPIKRNSGEYHEFDPLESRE